MRRALRIVLLAMIVVLYGISIPWYRSGDAHGTLVGLPDWVAIALGCYVAVAVLNAVAWWLTEVPDEGIDR